MRAFLLLIPVLVSAFVALESIDAGRINTEEIPIAVISSFAESYPGARIINAVTQQKDGVTVYGIESIDGKTRRDIVYSSEGRALEIEEDVKPSRLPKPVFESIKERYPKGKIKSAEKLTRGTAIVYEVAVVTRDGTFEILIDPVGKTSKTRKQRS